MNSDIARQNNEVLSKEARRIEEEKKNITSLDQSRANIVENEEVKQR